MDNLGFEGFEAFKIVVNSYTLRTGVQKMLGEGVTLL